MKNFIERLKKRKSFKLFFISLLAYVIEIILNLADIFNLLPEPILFVFGILKFIFYVILIYYALLFLAWLKRKITWKIRNRLIISQIFISVVPIVLISSLAIIGFLLITYQVASFQINNFLLTRAHEFRDAFNAAVNSSGLSKNTPESLESFYEIIKKNESKQTAFSPLLLFARRSQDEKNKFSLILRDKTAVLNDVISFDLLSTSPDILYSKYISDIIKKHIDLKHYTIGIPDVYFITHRQLGDMDIYALCPLSLSHLQGITSSLGYSLAKNYYVGTSVLSNEELKIDLKENAKIEVTSTEKDEFPVLILLKTLASVQDKPDLPMHAVVINFDFSDSAKNIFYGKSYVGVIGTNLLRALLTVAIIFIFVEIVSLFIGVKMTSRITKAVDSLHKGTNRIQSGDLDAKIDIKTDDQLGELAGSFNAMASSMRELLVEKAKKEAMERELEIAHDVQKHLFPQQTVTFHGLEIINKFLSARIVSGDYYDFFPFKDKFALVIGDVSGKGISAGLIMANTQAILRSFYLQSLTNGNVFNLQELVRTINSHIINYTSSNKFITMHFSVFDMVQSELTYVNAGHPCPIIVRADNSIEKLQATGTVLGVFENAHFPVHTTRLAPDDLIFYYTDGLLEAYADDLEEYGEDRLIEFVKHRKNMPLPQLVSTLLEDIRKFSQPDLHDDIALIAIKMKPE